MGEKFVKAYSEQSDEDEARNRLQIGMTLFYKFTESILQNEKTIRSDISALVEKDLFYQCMFACCLEITLFTYGFTQKFPWILDALHIEAVHFVKVIELIVRLKDPLSRDMIKHLNKIEETVIESLTWRSESQIWEAIKNSGQDIPKFEDIALPAHLLYNDKTSSKLHNSESPNGQSPVPSAMDSFQSPMQQRQLFSGIQPGQSVLQRHTHIMITDKDGNRKLIPLVENDRTSTNTPQQTPKAKSDPPAQPKRTGSLTIIFRKFYNLAGVRMEHLCSKLGLTDIELKQKIWTVFEDSIRYSDLIKDRHLDQLLMCAIYMICRISRISVKFQDIMKFYREQPQCNSKVYRDVLFTRVKTEEDGGIVPEQRSDLINFYNSVYVDVMQKYAVKIRSSLQNNVLLSPLPAIKRDLVSPSIQVVGNVFIKPLESPSTTSSGTCFNYYFSRSPSKDLKDINKLVNNSKVTGKRLLVDTDTPPNKRTSTTKKFQSLVEERRSQNGD